MQKEIRERSWENYIREEHRGRDIAEMPEEKTVAKGTRVGLLWGGSRGDPSEAGERGSERRRLGRDRGLGSRCRFSMGAEAGPADQGRDL